MEDTYQRDATGTPITLTPRNSCRGIAQLSLVSAPVEDSPPSAG